jgi:hypothetical protein
MGIRNIKLDWERSGIFVWISGDHFSVRILLDLEINEILN